MGLFLVSDGSYGDSVACVEDRLPLVVIEAEDASDEKVLEAVKKFAEVTGTDLAEVVVNQLSAPLS